MVNKQLLDYIESVRKKGYKDEAIKAHLLKYNYSSSDVEEAFSQLDKVKSKSSISHHNIIIYVILVILVLGLAGGAYFFFNGALYFSSQVCQNVSIDLYRTDEEPVICVFEDRSRIQMIMENKGSRQIDFVNVVVKTERKTYKETLDNLFIPGEDLITKVIYLDEPTNVNEVKITPGIIEEGRKYTCNSDSSVYKDIKTC